jgi:hypothetical protein
MTGANKLESLEGKVSVNVLDEMVIAVDSLSCIETTTLLQFGVDVAARVYRVIRDAQFAGRIAQLPTMPQPERPGDTGHTILRTIIFGYFHGQPSFVESRIFHEDDAVQSPIVINQQLHQAWMSGLPEVSRLLFKAGPSPFASYSPFIPTSRAPSLAEVIGMARQYIIACGSPEAIQTDPESAIGIGGRTQMATLTPHDGFRWVNGYGPLL